MDKEPLLPSYLSTNSSPRRKPHPLHHLQHLHLQQHQQQFPATSTPPPLFTLPENGELTLPLLAQSPLTPSEIKDRLIFGASSPTPTPTPTPTNLHHSTTVDALILDSPHKFAQPLPSPSSNNPTSSSSRRNEPLNPSLFLPWHKSNLHRSKTAPAMAVINDFKPRSTLPKPKFNSSSIVRQAFVLLVLYLSLGVLIYSFNRKHFDATETHPVVDALYFCIVTMCTIGYGDITPRTNSAKLFSIMFVLVGFGFVDILLSGMVSYVLDIQENLMLSTVKAGEKHDLAKTYIFDLKKGRMRIRMKVALALGVVVVCIGIGTGVMHFVEKLGWLDSFYLSVMSVTTVGYGDRAFKSLPGRLFASVWLLVSTLAVARAFLYLAEARVDKRHRRIAKLVLRQDMTVSQFLAADIDNNGFVSKSEYVIYKLKEMEKITEKDILPICTQFDRLDTGNCGKITLSDLMEHHHHI